MHLRRRILMKDHRWVLEPGESVPDIGPEPMPERPAYFREQSKASRNDMLRSLRKTALRKIVRGGHR